MKHQTDDTLRAYMDGELPVGAAAGVARHLADCAECSATAAELRETAGVFAGALARMDAVEPARWAASTDGTAQLFGATTHAASPATMDDPARVHGSTYDAEPIVARPIRSAPSLVLDRNARAARRSSPAVWRWAAGIALAVAAGGSAAIATGLIGRATTTTSPPSAPATIVETTAAPSSGVFALPADGAVEVLLTGTPEGSRVIVALTDADEGFVEVTDMEPADVQAPRFEIEQGRVAVDLGDHARIVHVTMPRGLRSATVIWQGRIVVEVADGAVTPDGATTGGVVLRAQH